MFLFAHLFAGCLIGLILSRWFRDARILPVAAFFSVLPDLLDKPIGHILFAGTLSNGRIFFHSILAIAILVVVTLLLIPLVFTGSRIRWVVPALIAGFLSHQLLDGMWNEPVSWYYPLLGPFQPAYNPDFFLHSILAEITCPSEWLFGISCLLVAATWYRDFSGAGSRVPGILCRGGNCLGMGLVLIAAGSWSLAAGILGGGNSLAPTFDPENSLILAILLFWGGISFLLLRTGFFLSGEHPDRIQQNSGK